MNLKTKITVMFFFLKSKLKVYYSSSEANCLYKVTVLSAQLSGKKRFKKKTIPLKILYDDVLL